MVTQEATCALKNATKIRIWTWMIENTSKDEVKSSQ